MRKTATKLCKIQALCKIDAVMKDLSAEEANALATKLKDMESKKKRNNNANDDNENEDGELDPGTFYYSHFPVLINNRFLLVLADCKDMVDDEEDPALVAAEKMLAEEMGEDEDC